MKENERKRMRENERYPKRSRRDDVLAQFNFLVFRHGGCVCFCVLFCLCLLCLLCLLVLSWKVFFIFQGVFSTPQKPLNQYPFYMKKS